MQNNAPVTRTELDTLAAVGSKCPRCTQDHEDTFHPTTPCHPRLNLAVVSYAKGSGILRVTCFICGKLTLEVRVAE